MTLDDVMREFTSRRGEIVTSESMQEILAALSDVGRWSAIIEIADNNTARALEKLEASRGVALREALAVDELLLEGCDGAAKDAIKSARQRIANLRVEADIRFAPTGRRPYRDVAADHRWPHLAGGGRARLSRCLAGVQAYPSAAVGEGPGADRSGDELRWRWRADACDDACPARGLGRGAFGGLAPGLWMSSAAGGSRASGRRDSAPPLASQSRRHA